MSNLMRDQFEAAFNNEDSCLTGFDFGWSEQRNCYDQYAVHLVFKGWQAALESRWIKCSERMPELKTLALVFIGNETGDIDIAYFGKNGRWLSDDSNSSFDYITHWQPLPKAPKVEL